MRKFGVYNGKEYKDGEEINQCCFNVSDDITEEKLQEEIKYHRGKCISCAVNCGYSCECSPCNEMR